MPYIPAAEAQRRLSERLIKVLRAKLADEANALNAGEGATGNPLPIPHHSAYFRLGNDADIERVLSATGSCVMITPTGEVDQTEARTGDASVYSRLDRSRWRVLLLIRAPVGFTNIVVDGVALLPAEVLYKLADRMRGALMLTLAKYAIDQDAIHDLKVVNHYADYSVLRNATLTGRAVLEIEVTQDVLMPQPITGGVP